MSQTEATTPQTAAREVTGPRPRRHWAADATAIFAVLAASWFLLLSLGATIAYTPVGVSPGEVGMGYAAVLTQPLAGFVVTLAVLLIVFGLVAHLGFGWRVSSPSTRDLTVSLGVAVVILSLIVVNGGFGAAQKLKAGEKHRDTIFWIPLAYPWSGEVAKLSWARGSGGPLPSCALYLGQANGISVFYDAEHKRTWRIPSSDLVVTSEPSADRCP